MIKFNHNDIAHKMKKDVSSTTDSHIC